jgi:hypothetical protein
MVSRVVRRGGALAAGLVVLLSAGSTIADCPDVRQLHQDWRRVLDVPVQADDLAGYPFRDCFRAAAERHGLPVHLLLGVAWGESAFDPTARSSKNAVGVMQIRWPGTARDLGFDSIRALMDPCRNIDAGARYLRWLFDRVGGDPVLALASYNHGPGAIDGRYRNVTRHARDYVCYIYDKTVRVLSGVRPGAANVLLRLGRFTDYGMARTTLESYRRRARLRDRVDLNLEIQRSGSGGYELRLPCRNAEELRKERARYERITGFVPH